MGGEAADVVDRAAGNDEAHGRRRYLRPVIMTDPAAAVVRRDTGWWDLPAAADAPTWETDAEFAGIRAERRGREFRTVGVVGLGTMGAGIVEVFAREGLTVVGVEPTEDALERGRGHLTHSTDRAVRRGKLSEADRDALIGRVRFTTSMEDLADVDLVIEAVPERLDLKQEIFAAAGQDLPGRTRSWPPTPRRCRSPRSRWPRPGRTRSSGCTSSTPRRC